MTQTKATASQQPEIEISVLVPVMNEAGNIRPLIDEICEALKGRRFEIIYVDDASTDASPAELADSAAVIPQLRVLRHQSRAGQSAAIRSALPARPFCAACVRCAGLAAPRPPLRGGAMLGAFCGSDALTDRLLVVHLAQLGSGCVAVPNRWSRLRAQPYYE